MIGKWGGQALDAVVGVVLVVVVVVWMAAWINWTVYGCTTVQVSQWACQCTTECDGHTGLRTDPPWCDDDLTRNDVEVISVTSCRAELASYCGEYHCECLCTESRVDPSSCY